MKNTVLNNKLSLLLCLVIIGLNALAQPCRCNLSVDTDGDLTSDGILYQDEVYDFSDITVHSDEFGSLGAITYKEDAVKFDGTLEDLKMDLYFPNANHDPCALGGRPIIFFFHGGGLVEGNSLRVKNLSVYYAQRGYICAGVNYRKGYYGGTDGDGFDICDDLFESVYAVYRALQDERDAINFLIDNEDTFNIAIDPNKIFIHGPGIFPMVSVMDPNEWPGFITGMFGPLATIPEPAGGIARNASIPEVTRFLDSGDDMPALLFHGTCGKRVPFDLVKANRIYECGSTYAPRNYSVYGSNQLASILHGHTRFFPICGLTHQLEKLEEYLLFEETTSFMYDVICETVNPATPDILVPYSVDPGDISTKCEPSDLTYTFCDTATVMPPLDSLRIAGPVAFTTNLKIWPNPTEGQFQVQIPSIEFAGSAFSEEADMLYVIDISGKEILRTKVISGQTVTISMPENAAKGLYLVKTSQHSATIYFQ